MKRILSLVCALFICCSTYVWAEDAVQEQDSLALVAFYNATNGGGWLNSNNWLSGDVSAWYGIKVEDGRVVAINLSSNGLTGSLPSEIGDLTKLAYLYISYNQLAGSIPAEISNLTELKVLWAGHNELSGEIPASIGMLDSLETMNLSHNSLSGGIPLGVGNLTSLENLNLQFNNLKFSVPDTIGSLLKLKYLYLNNCKFTGSFPSSVSNLTQLCFLTVQNNYLTNFPDLSGITALGLNDGAIHFSLHTNYLDFHDIAPNVALLGDKSNYSPQRTFATGADVLLRPGDSIWFNMPNQTFINTSDTITTYTYKRNGAIVQSDTSTAYVISSASANDLGSYICYATRADVPGLNLNMATVKLFSEADSTWLSLGVLIDGVLVDTVAFDIELYKATDSTYFKSTVAPQYYDMRSEVLIANGNYFIKLVPHNSDLMPTYVTDDFGWTESAVSSAASGGSLIFNTTIKSQPEVTGSNNTNISGQISWMARGEVYEPYSIVEGAAADPFAGADVYLVNSDNSSYDYHMRTGSDGLYNFSHIPYGNYEIKIDYTGYTMVERSFVAVDAVDPIIENKNFNLIDTASLVLDVKAINTKNDQFELYPNPSNGRILLQSNLLFNQLVAIRLFDLSGKLMLNHQVLNAPTQLNLNLNDLASRQIEPGFYLLDATIGTRRMTRTIVIK